MFSPTTPSITTLLLLASLCAGCASSPYNGETNADPTPPSTQPSESTQDSTAAIELRYDVQPMQEPTLNDMQPDQQHPPLSQPSSDDAILQRIDSLRHQLLGQHDTVLRDYEEQDALYADLEVQHRLSRTLRGRLSELREMVLQMQVFQGRMIEYHNRSKAQHRRPAPSPSQKSPAYGSAADRERYRTHFEYFRYLRRVAGHHLQLATLHRHMQVLSLTDGLRDLSRRHELLASHHDTIAHTCHQIRLLMQQHFHLDPTDEKLRDPLENTPEELDAPDLLITI